MGDSNTIVLDFSSLSEEEAMEAAQLQIMNAVKKASNVLSHAVEAKTRELASDGLKSTRQQYLDALSLIEVADGVWVVNLDDSAAWIEDGTPERSGYDFLLNGPKARTSKDGHKWNIIPFEHSKPASQNSPSAKQIVSTLKAELKKKGIPFKGIEMMDTVKYDEHGAPHVSKSIPMTGKLHSFDLPSKKPGKGKFPALSGVNIYQSVSKTGVARRDIFTFRVISDKTRGDGRWQYKEQPAKDFMEKALEEIMQDFDSIFTDSFEDALKGGK